MWLAKRDNIPYNYIGTCMTILNKFDPHPELLRKFYNDIVSKIGCHRAVFDFKKSLELYDANEHRNQEMDDKIKLLHIDELRDEIEGFTKEKEDSYGTHVSLDARNTKSRATFIRNLILIIAAICGLLYELSNVG